MDIPSHYGYIPISKRTIFSWPVLLLLFSVLVITVLYWLWWKYNIWNFQTIPTFSTNWQMLMLLQISFYFRNAAAHPSVSFFQFLCGMCSIHPQRKTGVFYLWTGLRPVVLCFSPETFEAVLKSPNNLQKSFDYTFLSQWLKEGLLTSQGAKWKQRRKILTPAFHFRILEDFVDIFDNQSKCMVKKIKSAIEMEKIIDVVPYITMCTLDIICETAMGSTINAQDNHNHFYVKSMYKVCKEFVGRIFRPWLWPDWIYFSTNRGKRFKQHSSYMEKFTKKVIQDRKSQLLSKLSDQARKEKSDTENTGKKKAFIDLLLDMHVSDPHNFTEKDIQEEVDTFMFGGHDTTAVGSSWILYLLGLHPDVQEKVIEEIYEECGDDPESPISVECLKKLKYLECVMKETQRIYTPAPYIARHLQEDVEVNGIRIPKGITCMLVIYVLHRNEEWFPDPEKFDPDRFLPDNCLHRHPFAYCPFSAGPRSCIGQKFAFLEEKTMVVNVLRNFKVRSVQQRDKLHLASEMVLRSRGGIKLEFDPRK